MPPALEKKYDETTIHKFVNEIGSGRALVLSASKHLSSATYCI